MSRLSQMLTHQLLKSGKSGRDIAREFGWQSQSFLQWKDGTVPNSAFYPNIARFLGISNDMVIELAEEAKISRHLTKLPNMRLTTTKPEAPPLATGAKQTNVAPAVIADRKVGKFKFDDIPKRRYTLKIDTRVMEPALLIGKSAVIDPAVWPAMGRDVIVFGKGGNAWLGRLESTSTDPESGSVAVISRYAAETLTIKDVQAVHVIVLSDRA